MLTGPEVSGGKFVNAHANLFRADIPETVRHREPAVIRTRFVGAGLALYPFRGRMQRREPLR